MLIKSPGIGTRLLTLIVLVSFFMLSLSEYDKTYIPVINKNTPNGAIESCPEHMKHNPLTELIRQAIGKSDNKEHSEKICFCYNTDIRKNVKHYLTDAELYKFDFREADLRVDSCLLIPEKIVLTSRNKSPPLFPDLKTYIQ